MIRETLSRIVNKLRTLVSSSIRVAKVYDFSSCPAQVGGIRYNLIETGRKTALRDVRLYGEAEVPLLTSNLPDAYWAEVKNGSVIGDSSVVLSPGGFVLYDMLFHRRSYGANITDHGLMLLFGRPHFLGKRVFYNYKGREKIAEGISLAANMSNNYYHFMFTVASKFFYLSKMNLDAGIPLLVDECVLETTQMREVLQSLNVSNRKIEPLIAGKKYDVQRLYCISSPNVVVPNFIGGTERLGGFSFDSGALDFIRDAFLPGARREEERGERLFLSRKHCRKRRCNEEDLLPILEKYGFRTVFPETMTVREQAELFNSAEHIIGASGAAFSNLVFCRRNTGVLILESWSSTCFSALGAAARLKMCYINGEKVSGGQHSDFVVDPGQLAGYLENYYAGV